MDSGNFAFNKFSMPPLRVAVEDGQPAQDPFIWTYTVLSLNPIKSIAPPSLSTAGFTYSSRTA